MTTKELIALHQRMCDKARSLMVRKNHDYAGEAKVFANFERVKAMDICEVDTGFFVRMCDKFSRIITLSQTSKVLVSDESVQDTLVDIINYPILYAGWLIQQQERQNIIHDHGKNNRRQSQRRNQRSANNISSHVPALHTFGNDDPPCLQPKRSEQQGDPNKAISRRRAAKPSNPNALGSKSERNASVRRVRRSS